ncbi:hypothetical protein CAPTEDRAFT_197284 [Capitella teleta]|uniref:G-protein coupled receptors family 1 profile domain-containing protein n=1 Tax=Capitella teleta TaxID=283909 RepID=R7U1M4_CAPTE|nr:hypothetical protein CAPTEDRAFT_197284 [Capitella teleta]|eukprot:ELT99767.1 hypothetical protein CAPTEDRAFT_197284 [Capitella teleta]
MDCLNVSKNESVKSKYDITNECATFDFIIYTVIVGCLCIFGLVGNALSFIILWRDSTKTGATSFILRALAVADSLVLLATIPLYVIPFIYPAVGAFKSFYDVYPNIVPFLWPVYLIPYTATILLTVLVSMNRYFAVCRPLSSSTMCGLPQVTRHVTWITVFSVVYNIPRFFEYEKKLTCEGYNQTKEVFEVSEFGNNKMYRIIYANVLYFVILLGGPLLCLAFLNVKLIFALKQRQQKRADMGKGGFQQDLTLVLVAVIFTFMFCQTPTFVDHILWTFVSEATPECGNWHYYYTAIGDMFSIVNSSTNFVIYVLTSRKFRQGLLVTFCCQHDPNNGSPEPQTRLTNHNDHRVASEPLMRKQETMALVSKNGTTTQAARTDK